MEYFVFVRRPSKSTLLDLSAQNGNYLYIYDIFYSCRRQEKILEYLWLKPSKRDFVCHSEIRYCVLLSEKHAVWLFYIAIYLMTQLYFSKVWMRKCVIIRNDVIDYFWHALFRINMSCRKTSLIIETINTLHIHDCTSPRFKTNVLSKYRIKKKYYFMTKDKRRSYIETIITIFSNIKMIFALIT